MDTFDKIQKEMIELSNPDEDELKFTFASLMDMKKTELVELCQQLDLATSGNKDELANRIMEASDDLYVLEGTSKITFVQNDEEEVGQAKRV